MKYVKSEMPLYVVMTLGFRKSLLDVRILGSEPLTDNDHTMERKNALREKIIKRIDLVKVKKACENKFFSLKIIFYLNKNSKVQGQYQKDLDNMAKIVSDVLTDYLSEQDKTNNEKTGLGLMPDDEDIHELHLFKKFVDKDSEQGLDIKLYKLSEKNER